MFDPCSDVLDPELQEEFLELCSVVFLLVEHRNELAAVIRQYLSRFHTLEGRFQNLEKGLYGIAILHM